MNIVNTIPYRFKEHGFDYTLLSVKNDFSHPPDETLISAEYENQYGITKTFSAKQLLPRCL